MTEVPFQTIDVGQEFIHVRPYTKRMDKCVKIKPFWANFIDQRRVYNAVTSQGQCYFFEPGDLVHIHK